MINGIRWTKSYGGYCKEIPNYNARIGHIKLWCGPSIKYLRNGGVRPIGWTGYIYFEDRQIDHTPREQSLEFTQREAEKLAIQYLFGYGFATLKTLKKMDLLEEMLFEVGVDL